MTRNRRAIVLIAALTLVATACNRGATEVTTTTTVPSDTSSSTTSTTAVPVTTTTTTTTIPSGPAIAQEGDENETVEAIQFLLTCTGHGDLTVDGNFGPATRAAVEAAQTALGRAVTGAIDDETFAELSRACATPREFAADDAPIEVVGNAAPGDPEVIDITGLAKSVVTASIAPPGLVVTVTTSDGTVVPPAEGDDSTWEIEAGDHRILVEPPLEATTFVLEVDVLEGAELAGEWILGTDRLTFGDVELEIGDDADTVIDHIFDILGHGVRGNYDEFDTDWYEISDPQSIGLRGIYIEGMAFLFYGPHAGEPDRPETLARIRFEGPSDDADGNPRPENYVTTAEGITVGDTLADLKSAYGSDVASGNNDEEHYYRYADSRGELCFYFGGTAPTDTSPILEIATECRS